MWRMRPLQGQWRNKKEKRTGKKNWFPAQQNGQVSPRCGDILGAQ